jgi:hypothetical protein
MNVSQEEAARAIQEIETSRAAMRTLVRAHRGHLYLWIWGAVWIAISLVNLMAAPRSGMPSNCLAAAGVVATFAVMFFQSMRVRIRVNMRFMGVCIAILAFSYGVWPMMLGWPHTAKAAFGYSTLVWMQLYVVAGIWFDNYLLWLGVAVTALLLAGFIFFPGFFWMWSLLGGLTLLGTGFYVRLFWR